MKFRILVCGCGKLGTRYLEGLLNFNCESEIYVYDFSIESINNSKKNCKKISIQILIIKTKQILKNNQISFS